MEMNVEDTSPEPREIGGKEIANHDRSPEPKRKGDSVEVFENIFNEDDDISSSDEEGLAAFSKSEVIVKCLFCHKSFFGQIGLDQHMTRFHPDLVDHREKIPPGPSVHLQARSVAGTSGVSASTKGKKQRKIAERKYKCATCGKSFLSLKQLKQHEATGLHKKKLKEMEARGEPVSGSSTPAKVTTGP